MGQHKSQKFKYVSQLCFRYLPAERQWVSGMLDESVPCGFICLLFGVFNALGLHKHCKAVSATV